MVDQAVYERIKNYLFLVVDDVGNMRTILKRMLRNLGFRNVIDANDGDSAYEMIKNRKIDFIIADWRMPHVTGIELLRMLRAEPRFHEIPFVIITGEVEEKRIVQAAECEIDGYIIKPFFAKTLEDKIFAVIERKENPLPFDQHIFKAQSLLEISEFEKALEECNKAISLKPESARAQNILGNIHLKMGNEELGEQEIEKAIDLNPLYIRANEDLAEHYAAKGDQENALKYYEKADDISPHNVKRQLATGKIYLNLGRADKAKKAFDVAQKNTKEDDPTIISEIAEAYLAKGFDEEAISAFQKNLEIDSRDLNAYNKLGIALRKQSRFDEAIMEYEKAMLINRDDEVIHYNIARAYHEFGEWDKAMRHIERSLELDPDFEEAKKFMKVLTGE